MHAYVQKLIIFSCIVLFIASWSSFLRQSLPSLHHEGRLAPENPIRNRTLGVSFLLFVLQADTFR